MVVCLLFFEHIFLIYFFLKVHMNATSYKKGIFLFIGTYKKTNKQTHTEDHTAIVVTFYYD